MYYFASDIHLGAGDRAAARRIERRFVAWLDAAARDAEAIFLVGDIFDFWFEYRRVVPKGFVRTLGKLAELSDRGVRVVFFTGNHDMWVGDYLARECGVEIHTSPQVMTLAGKKIFIAHGDNLNIGDQPLLRLLNAVFRSRTLRWLFSWGVHPDWALRFGRWWSGKSRKRHDAARAAQPASENEPCAREAAENEPFARDAAENKPCTRDAAESGSCAETAATGSSADTAAASGTGCAVPAVVCGEPHTEPLIAYAREYARKHEVDHFVFGHMHFPHDYRDGALHVVNLGCWAESPSCAVLDGEGELTLRMLGR